VVNRQARDRLANAVQVARTEMFAGAIPEARNHNVNLCEASTATVTEQWAHT
jgi:fibronectin type 3 domain-containing protein